MNDHPAPAAPHADSLTPNDWDAHLKKITDKAANASTGASSGTTPGDTSGPVAHVVCIVDRSGSMSSIREDAVGGFNTFLAEQQALPDAADLTLVLFDHEYDLVHDAVPIGAVRPLDAQTYQPRGTTALYDAIGRTFEHVSRRAAAQDAGATNGGALLGGAPVGGAPVIACILTDGMENASQDYTAEAIRRLIEAKRAAGWEFVFLAANQDAFATARAMAMPQSAAASFRASPEGVREAYSMMSDRVSFSREAFAREVAERESEARRAEDA